MTLAKGELELRRTGNPDDIKLADQLRARIEKSGDFSLSGTESLKVYPEISLEAEIERQAGRYLELEFHKHKKIGMSEGKFKDLIMGLVASQPESFRGTLDTPFVRFGQIPVKDQCRLAGIDYFLDGLNARDWPDDPQKYSTPQAAHIVWTDEGARFMYRHVGDVRRELKAHERGGTEFDAISQYVVKPQVLEKRSLDLPGTVVGSARAAFLGLWFGRPRLDGHFVADVGPGYGSLVCGRKK
jgi:hypothetical protein